MSDSLTDLWKLRKRGQRDADRHKELVEKAIKKHGKELISEYNIIKSDGAKKIKLPIRYLERYRIKYGANNKKDEMGQGLSGEPGDKYVTKNKKQGKGKGNKAGNEEDEIVYETEITIDEMVDMLIKDLNLPWMEDNEGDKQIEVITEDELTYSRIGNMSNLDIKKTIKENMKRNAQRGNAYLGDFTKEDIRYKTFEESKEYHTNAAVYLLLDRSASMELEKTKIARTFFFWAVQFLRKRYKNIDIIFIAHDVKAYLVEDENDFFKMLPGGGTVCSTAFEMAAEHIKINHPSKSWNNYLIALSDGDNYAIDNERCLEIITKILDEVKAIGYGEIIPKGSVSMNGMFGFANNQNTLSKLLNEKIKRTRFVTMNMENINDVFPSLEKFFNINKNK